MVNQVQGSKSMEAKVPPIVQSRPRIKILKPVRLFCDDVENIVGQLKQIGRVELSTDKVHLTISGPDDPVDCEKIWEKRPVRWLWFSLTKGGVFLASIVIHPTCVEFLRSYEWNPSESGEDMLAEVEKLLCNWRHPLFFLGERGWQLGGAFFALLVLLVAAIPVLLGIPSPLLMWLGAITGALAMAWIVIGWLLFPRSCLALHPTTREESQRRVWRLVYYALGALIIFACGFTLGVLVAIHR